MPRENKASFIMALNINSFICIQYAFNKETEIKLCALRETVW